MTVLKEYIEQVLTELRKDDKFIQHLQTIRSRQAVPIANIERMVNEWAAAQRGLKPEEVRLAHRIAIDKFPELLDKARQDVAAAKKMLFSLLTGQVVKRKTK